MGHLGAILVVDHPAVVAEVELVDVDVVTLADREEAERVAVPVEHLLHALNHVSGAVLGRPSRRAEHAERVVPTAGPAAEHVEIGQGTEVVDVQVGDEHLVELVERKPAGDVVRD